MRRLAIHLLITLFCPAFAFAQANGKLQIHYMDVGQGDGAVLISPLGEVVLFDDGVLNQCGKPIGYLQSLGITKIDYHVASHYHADHIGCAAQVLSIPSAVVTPAPTAIAAIRIGDAVGDSARTMALITVNSQSAENSTPIGSMPFMVGRCSSLVNGHRGRNRNRQS